MSKTRRELFTSLFSSVSDRTRDVRASSSTKGAPELLWPPGALEPSDAFLAACTGCGDCIEACPADALFTIERADGTPLPVIDPVRQPCLLCDDIPCIPACPEKALAPIASPEAIRIGIAKVNPATCITFRGEICDRCYQACPYPNQALMMIGGRPLVGSSFCTGCGLCERACPVSPRAIRVVPERHLVPGLRVPKSEMG
jgi:ferredoxin-type protein NapG